MNNNKNLAVLLTCFNRKIKTLNCLNSLYEANLPTAMSFDVFLVDDDSTDGTSEAVLRQFPKVSIVKGDGTLFWSRGMHTAWKAAVNHKDYDAYIWLNDDTILFKNALSIMISAVKETNYSSIICGATCSESDKSITYGAYKSKKDGLLVPNGELQECRIINGNFVLVPKIVFDKLGNFDWCFRHAIADFDYGLRAIEAGFKNYLAASFVGFCELNPTLPKWCLKETPLFERFKLLYSPLGYAEPIPFFIYEKRHFGLVTAIKHFISINLRALIPHLWK